MDLNASRTESSFLVIPPGLYSSKVCLIYDYLGNRNDISVSSLETHFSYYLAMKDPELENLAGDGICNLLPPAPKDAFLMTERLVRALVSAVDASVSNEAIFNSIAYKLQLVYIPNSVPNVH